MQIYTVFSSVSLSFDCATALPHPVSSAALANSNNIFFMGFNIRNLMPTQVLQYIVRWLK